MVRHQPGQLKQQNKQHKNKSGKRAQQRTLGPGKTESRLQQKNPSKLAKESRANRINRSNQLRKNKREQLWLQKRQNKVGEGAPKVIGIIPLMEAASADRALQMFLESHSSQAGSHHTQNEVGTMHHIHDSTGHALTYLLAPFSARRDLFNSLDIARASDVIIFVLNVDDQNGGIDTLVDQIGRDTIGAFVAVGCPDIIFCVEGMDAGVASQWTDDQMDSESAPSMRSTSSSRTSRKGASAMRKAIEHFIATDIGFPDARTVPLHPSRIPPLLRMLHSLTPKAPSWRTMRSYILAETCTVQQQQQPQQEQQQPLNEFAAAVDTQAEALCTVRLTGFLRGKPLLLHSLMHLVGVGAGRITKVWRLDADTDPNLLQAEEALQADESRQESLRMSAIADALAGEQTWPSEQEMLTAADSNNDIITQPQQQLPTGMSSYQADWFTDDAGNVDFAAAEGNEPSAAAAEEEEEDDGSDDDDGNDLCSTAAGSLMTGAISLSSKKLKARFAVGTNDGTNVAATQDAQFPDEMDTPDDVSARTRFARFRALQSFRASPWHPKENLPADYSKIFQFENFQGIQRRILAEAQALEKSQQQAALAKHSQEKKSAKKTSFDTDSCQMVLSAESSAQSSIVLAEAPDFLQTGQRVVVELADVPTGAAEKFSQLGHLLAMGLLPHEQKLSVLNFNMQKSAAFTESLKSKDPLLLQVGFRSFWSKPIFSENNLNCDKNKFERFLQSNCFSVGSCYGPVTVGAAPVLAFKQYTADGRWQLVAAGSVSSVDPDRIVLKKVVLSGYPIRVRKKYAVVKHMFHDPQDVRWFKPAELVTKFGLRGHIKEPVGTHGLFKAHFSDVIKQNDTVLLQLYKRVYPKFPFDKIVNGELQVK